jgi:hypothetical protein
MQDMPLVFKEDFESGKSDRFEPTDESAWTIKDQGGNKVYSLTKKKSDFKTPVRSPFNRALVKDIELGSFILDVRLQSTEADYGHRSLCLFFGYQDDSHLYYVHFGKQTDDHANQIFIVNESDRKKISTKTTPGTNWDDQWHHARVIRDAESGQIDVFFDDMQTPVMTAVDKTFLSGRVGIGSFDDKGQFDHIAVYGDEARTKVEKVSGTVTFNGKPLAGATVLFSPDDPNKTPAVGKTNDAGDFELSTFIAGDGAALGKYRIVISTKPEGAIPAKFGDAKTTGLTAEVKEGSNEFQFELKD